MLDGYPFTPAQARSLAVDGLGPTQIIYLDVDDETAITRLVSKPLGTKSDGSSEADEPIRPQDVRPKVSLWNQQLKQVLHEYREFGVCRIDAAKGKQQVWKSVQRALREPELTGPHMPPRVALIGPAGVGKRTLATMLADNLQAVHVRLPRLMKEIALWRNELSDKVAAQNSGVLSDELLAECVAFRLRQEDVRTHGFILDGIPATRPQAEAFAQRGITLTRVIALEAPDETLRARAKGRLLDPKTNNLYHIEFSKPPADVASRCVPYERDPPLVDESLKRWRASVRGLKQVYSGVLRSIDATDSIEELGAIVRRFVLLPLGKESSTESKEAPAPSAATGK